MELESDEENPGYYRSKFYLKPHYQLEGLSVSLEIGLKNAEIVLDKPRTVGALSWLIDAYMYFQGYDNNYS